MRRITALILAAGILGLWIADPPALSGLEDKLTQPGVPSEVPDLPKTPEMPEDPGPPEGPGIRIYWALYPDVCNLGGESTFSAPAGTYGVFYFDTQELPLCANPLAFGNENVKAFPHPGPAPAAIDCRPGDACSNSLSTIQGDWVAIIDWDDWHGRTVDRVTRTTMGLATETVLVALESHVLPSPAITEADLIMTLATVAQAVDQGTPPPLVINMSFGRMREIDDPRGIQCPEDRLSCQVSLLLNHLARPGDNGAPGSVLVAAAGNHQEPLFPAWLEHVVSVGALDFAQFFANHVVVPSWETPLALDFPQALMPGEALCLNAFIAGDFVEWMPPAGSSFASAFFSGWLMEALLFQPAPVYTALGSGPGWQPRQVCTAGSPCFFALAHGATTFTSRTASAGQRMMAALAEDGSNCGSSQGLGLSITVELEPLDPSKNPFLSPSLVEMVSDRLKPAPEPDPCVPCSMCCGSDLLPTQGLGSASGVVEVNLEIDLHLGWKLLDGMELEEMFVRLPPDLLYLPLSKLDRYHIGNGDVAFLNLHGQVQSFDPSRQPTLVSLLSWYDPAENKLSYFWDATPILLPLDP